MKIPYFDAHCDTLSRCVNTGEPLWKNGGHLDLQRLDSYGPCGQIFALYANSKRCTHEECFALISRQAEVFFQAKRDYPELMKECWLSVEGAELFGCDPERLPMLKEWGVRWINLTWNHETELAQPHTMDGGLTSKGRDFVRRGAGLGIATDVSHLSDRGIRELLEMPEVPVLASHSNSRKLCGESRNLPDELARGIIERGGFIGLNFYVGFLGEKPTLDTLIAHLEHFLEMGGENHVGLGSDYDGAEPVPELDGVEKMPALWEALERRNYSSDLIYRLAYGNLAAFINKYC